MKHPKCACGHRLADHVVAAHPTARTRLGCQKCACTNVPDGGKAQAELMDTEHMVNDLLNSLVKEMNRGA